MSFRDEMFGVMGGWRDSVNPASIDVARERVMDAARVLAWDLHGRSCDEKLSDYEVTLLNEMSVLEGYKRRPWDGLRAEQGKE